MRGGTRSRGARCTVRTLSARTRAPTKQTDPYCLPGERTSRGEATRGGESTEREPGAEKGPYARRHPKPGREVYCSYVERPDEGANKADGPLLPPGRTNEPRRSRARW